MQSIIKASEKAIDKGMSYKKIKQINEMAMLALKVGFSKDTVENRALKDIYQLVK